MSEPRTRKNRLAKGPATILLFSLLSSSCSLVSIPESSWSRGEERPSFSVYLQEKSEAFTVVSQNPISVKRGDRAEFTIQMKQDYRAQALLHNGVELEHFAIEENRHSTTLVIPNVRYPISVEVECIQPEYEILYHPNGATYTNGDDPSEPYSRGYSLRSRLRPNTELGTDKLYRPGYVLTGWNTEPDGSGEHTGLGSRVTIPSADEPLHLYAEWEKEDDPSLFNYSRLTDGIRINEYIGDKEKVVVPSHINDVPVYDVSMNCFHGNEKTVIFPQSIFYIENGAFAGSQVEEIYFYDNINYISDDSFKDCPNFKSIHINAILAPRYGRRNLYSEINLADKYDILILNKDKK